MMAASLTMSLTIFAAGSMVYEEEGQFSIFLRYLYVLLAFTTADTDPIKCGRSIVSMPTGRMPFDVKSLISA